MNEDELDLTTLRCEECGSETWTRWEHGTYQETHTIDIAGKREKWEGHEEWVEESEEFYCSNDHQATDEQEVMLMDAMGMF